MKEKLTELKNYFSEKTTLRPKVLLVLGSGLGPFVDELSSKYQISYRDIPHFKQTSVTGHQGSLFFGKIGETEIAVMSGRLHPYEGHDLNDVVLPIRAMAEFGVTKVILTNAAGSVNERFHPGDIVLIKDHINLSGLNVLKGSNFDFLGPRFPDMSDTYTKKLRELSYRKAQELKIQLKEGVYAGVLGPTYETPSEIKMIRTLGGDMAGMSTIQESICSRHLGLDLLGFSTITNYGCGIKEGKLDHNKIKEEAKRALPQFNRLLKAIIPEV